MGRGVVVLVTPPPSVLRFGVMATPREIRRVRLLIPDTEAIYGPDEDEYIFADEDIELYLEEGFGNAKCAGGLAKMAVGGSEALILKVIKNYETSTNGAQLMREWTRAGEVLYDRGLDEVNDEGGEFFMAVFPEFDEFRHEEGRTHGSYPIGPYA